jgi:hypothetical protein
MTDCVKFHFDIDGDNFTSAGEASVRIKKSLREMGFTPETIRRVSVAMYEGEINMVIHANGGTADVNVYVDKIEIILSDMVLLQYSYILKDDHQESAAMFY